MLSSLAKSREGLTLTELLVTSAVVGVIMIGIVASDYAMRSMEQGTSRKSEVFMATTAAFHDIVKNVALATGGIGDCTVANLGVQVAEGNTNNNNYLCVRQDLTNPGGVSLNTPWDTADDRWLCYSRYKQAGRPSQLLRCITNAAQSCNNPDNEIGLVTDTTWGAASGHLTVFCSNVSPNQDYYVQITLINRFNPLLAASISNPEIILTNRVYPNY